MKALRLAAAAALLAGAAAPAPAAQTGFYAGLTGTAMAFDGRYGKSTYRLDEAGARVSGFRSHDDADDALYGLGAMLGYRWELPGDGVWLSAEFEWLSHSGELSGRSPAACDHPPPCEWSLDHWADDWRLEPDSSRGLTLRLGFRAGFLGPDASLYVLAGVRRVQTERVRVYGGCFTTPWRPGAEDPRADCAAVRSDIPAYLPSVRSSRGIDFDVWTLGAGAELPLGGAYALQAEARYSDYGRERQLSTFPGGESPSALSARALGLALRVLRYF